jgi:hypothetical protein
MNLHEHARTLYRRRHFLHRQSDVAGLRSLESMCERRPPKARARAPRADWGSLASRRRSFRAPLSFAKNRTRR